MNQNIKYISEFNSLFPLDKPKVKMLLGDGASIWGILLLFLISIGLFVGFALLARGIYEDYEIKKNLVYLDAKIDGKCRSKLFFVDCDVELTYQKKKYKKGVFFLDFSSGDYTVNAVQHADKPELISIDLALEKIPSRSVIAFALLCLSFLLLYLFLLMIFARRPRTKYILQELNYHGGKLALYPIDVTWWGKRKQIKYMNTIKGTSKEISFVQSMKKDKYAPYFFAHEDEVCVVVVANSETGNFLVVDQGLNRFKMGKKEREQLRESLERLN